ncbi:DUF1622 domain-containing protein [Chryseobacterium sp. GP-SGM7]|uniref:DUF1622 domain-containing protein n=1 Tax=Chryseobacterium sp. GP-SGM7 TaxID=3411323 RepID=UPI003B950C72
MENIKIYIDYVARIIEVIGVLTIFAGAVIALVKYIFSNLRSYKILKQELGKAILLGLEILVAGDIIATVVTEPTIDRLLALGLIVLIRTFLSISIQVEVEGKFPWQKKEEI